VAVIDSYLVVQLDGDVVSMLPLTFSVLRIGRAPDNDLSLQDPGVSRYHVELHLTADSLTVTDLGSANGTLIDGVRLAAHQPTLLEPGSRLRIGPFDAVRLRPEPDRPARQPPVGPDGQQAARSARRPAAPIPSAEPPTRFPQGRPTAWPSLPDADQSIYLKYLPTMFIDPDGSDWDDERDFLGRFLLIMESVWEPLEHRQDHMEMYFDPKTCPPSFLPWLASWFDLPIAPHWSESRIRGMLGQVMELYRWRGTPYGMAQVIEMWTGFLPEIEESATQPHVFNVRLRVPAANQVDTLLIEDLLRQHKPAHAGFTLEIVHA
jgi:phage tail-like protein